MANKLAYVTIPGAGVVMIVRNMAEPIDCACEDPILEIPILYGDVDTAKDIAETLIALEA